jgi:hypothetical protein
MSAENPSDNTIYRAVIRHGRITILKRPFILMAQQARAYSDAVRKAGTTICEVEAGITSAGERELTVEPVAGCELDGQALDTLLGWAAVIGCTRVWLPDRVIDLDDSLLPAPEDVESSPCPTCGVSAHVDRVADELASLRRRGHRPRICPVCMSDSPELTVPAKTSELV